MSCIRTACTAIASCRRSSLLEAGLEVINVDNGTDYRRRALEHCSCTTGRSWKIDAAPSSKPSTRTGRGARRGSGPSHRASRAAFGAPGREWVWFDFRTALCGGPRCRTTTLEIAQQFHTVMLSNVPQILPRMASEARDSRCWWTC